MRETPLARVATILVVLAATFLAAACGDGTTAPPPDPPRATTVRVDPDAVELTFFGETVQLRADVLDQNGRAMAGAAVTWASDDTSVATVDESGLVTATGMGTAAITATAAEVARAFRVPWNSATVTVNPLGLDGNEQFPGQNALTNQVGRGNLEGTLVILDTPDTWHAELVQETAVNAGVPKLHIVTKSESEWADPQSGAFNIPENTRVVAIPLFGVFEWEGALLGKQNSIIGVASVGNVNTDEWNRGWGRDIYHPNHPWGSRRARVYKDVMAALRAANGKAVMATWAIINEDGTAEPWEHAVMCGDTMEWCFAVRMPDDLYNARASNGYPGTSLAAPILGALVFYLSQLWDTADEVWAVLKECAIDIGEPGPDREFGLGVPTANCDVVRERARQVSSASVSVRGSPPVPALLPDRGTDRMPLRPPRTVHRRMRKSP